MGNNPSSDKSQLADFARFPEMNPGPVLQVDSDGYVIMSNAAARDIFGSRLHDSCWQIICPGIDKKTWFSILHSQKATVIERKIEDKEFIFHHRRDRESDLVFVYGADITEQKKAERSLRESDELVRLLLNSTGEGIYGIDLQGNCTFANPACVKILGFSSVEEIIGKQIHKLVHQIGTNGKPGSLEQSQIFLALLKEQGIHKDNELMFRADNTSFPAEYWSRPVKQQGKIIGCVVTFRDISERKQNEKLQAEYTAALAEIASFPEMNPGPVLRIDIKGKVLMVNEAAHNIFKNISIGCNWRDICPDIDDSTWNTVINSNTFALERQIGDHDYIFTHRRDFDGDLVFVFGADVTDQKQAERALQQTEKMTALGKLSAGLAHELNNPAAAAGRAANQFLEILKRMQLATNELVKANINPAIWDSLVHRATEIRKRPVGNLTPLEVCDREEELQTWLESKEIDGAWEIATGLVTAGIGKSDLQDIASILPAQLLKPVIVWLCNVLSLYNLAGHVVSSIQNISKLVNVFKSYSHMDRAPSNNVDIHTGIEDTLTILTHRLKDGIEVVRQYSENLPHIQVRGSEFNQVWMILIDNAIDAMAEKGILTIHTFQEGQYLVVEIGDSGSGIPPEIQPRIFEPFFTTKDVGEGTGLSLDVAQRIVSKQCNGKIDFGSRPGNTVFRVCIPASAEVL